jgi:hypothetical protein
MVKKSDIFVEQFKKLLTNSSFCFPTDPVHHPSNFSSKKSQFNQYFCQISNHRIHKVEYHQAKHTWSYMLEPRWPNLTIESDTFLINSYLESLQNEDAIIVRDLLQNWAEYPKNRITQTFPDPNPDTSLNTFDRKTAVLLENQMFPGESLNSETSNQLIELQESEISEIKDNAHICMIEEYDYTSANNYRLWGFKHNKLL